MQFRRPGLLFIATLLLAGPALAQSEVQGDAHSAPFKVRVATKPVGSTGVNSSAGKRAALSQLDKEALNDARSGLEDAYRQKLSQGANPMARDESGETALHLAAYKGHTSIVRLLANIKGVLIDDRDDTGNTPMQLAAAAGKAEAVMILIQAGADPQLKNAEGIPPLIRAAIRGYYPVMSALLRGGADPLARDAEGRTAAAIIEKQRKGNWEEAVEMLHDAEKRPTPKSH